MHSSAEGWSTQQLIEFLAAVSAYEGGPTATLGAAERVAMAFDAEIVAVVQGGQVKACIGFPAGEAPLEEIAALADHGEGEFEVEGLGPCRFASAPMEGGAPGRLVIGRFGDSFSPAELELLRGMGRILSLSLHTIALLQKERALRETTQRQAEENSRLLVSLRERQTLLERLSRVQRSIATSTALQEVLDSIVAGAAELLGDPVVGLRLINPDDPSRVDLVSSTGVDQRLLDHVRRSRVGTGAGGKAIETGELTVIEGYSESREALPDFAAEGLAAAMAAPIRQREEVVGSLVVGSYEAGRAYSASEREMLTAFAEHAGLALNDARATTETIHQAFHDSLTGLANRALFLDRLAESITRNRRSDTTTAVLFADLDGFKKVNDGLGHAAGDELLVMVARRLEDSFRPADVVARFGGDEFAILLGDIEDEGQATSSAERVLRELAAPFRVRGREVFVNASVGIAAGEEEPDHLLRNADLAMYHAKSRGKARFETFEPGMHAAAVERLDLEVDLKRAVEREQLVLHYQPVCRLETGEILAIEALVRWNHPDRGVVGPNEFIPLAEESGQILEIGRWVLREACRQGALWQARYPAEPRLAMCVNVSGVQLERADLVEEVSQALEQADLEPAGLILEITESALMADLEANVPRLCQLRGLGVRVAVDDFGTGYSSLEYLRRLPVDVLKIAKPFIDGLLDSSEGPALAKAIIDLSDSVGLSTIAEGVEQSEQRARLIELGCELAQGFRFSKPIDAAAMDSLLLRAGMLGPEWVQAPSPPKSAEETGARAVSPT